MDFADVLGMGRHLVPNLRDVPVVVGHHLVGVQEQLVGLFAGSHDPVQVVPEDRMIFRVVGIDDLIFNSLDPVGNS